MYKAAKDDIEQYEYFYNNANGEGANTEGWYTSYERNNKILKYKYEEGCKLVTSLCECVVEAPIHHVVSMFEEIDLFKDWFPYTKDVQMLSKITEGRHLLRSIQNMPWPLADRELLFRCAGIFYEKKKSVIYAFKSIDDSEKYFGELVPGV